MSEPVADAHAAVGQSGYINPRGTSLLVADGGDLSVETVGCLAGTAPSDVAVGFDSAYFDATTGRVLLHVASGYLLDGRYRLFVCGDSTLVDARRPDDRRQRRRHRR